MDESRQSKKTFPMRIRYVLALACFIVGALWLWQGYRELKDAATDKSSSTIIEDQFEKKLRESNAFTLFNDPQLDIQFQYPASWEKTVTEEGVQKAIIFQTLNNLVQIRMSIIRVTSGLVPGSVRWTPDMLIDELKKEPQLQEVSRGPISIVGIEGRTAIFEQTEGDTKVKLEIRSFVKDDTMYTVMFIAVENYGLSDRFQPIFERVVDSFQVIVRNH